MKNNKILIIGLALMLLLVSIAAVSAEGWSLSSKTATRTNPDGTTSTMEINNGVLTLEGVKFNIPDVYQEVENERELGDNEDDYGFKDSKKSTCVFKRDDNTITMSVIYNTDASFDKLPKTEEKQEEKTISGKDGLYYVDEGKAYFEYLEDGKIIEISSTNPDLIEHIIA